MNIGFKIAEADVAKRCSKKQTVLVIMAASWHQLAWLGKNYPIKVQLNATWLHSISIKKRAAATARFCKSEAL
ncbi:MAG: hypothetical protein V4495_12855 [Pseudomonadota bacterium]